MLRALPRSTRTDTLFPYSTLFRARSVSARREFGGGRLPGLLAIGTIVDDHPEALDGRGIDVRGRELRRDRQPVADLLGGHNPSPVCYAVAGRRARSEEHTSELQSLMRISYAVFCLKQKNNNEDDSRVQDTDCT